MFKEKSILACGPAATCGLELCCIWDVNADASYDVPVERARRVSRELRPEGGTGLIAVRTLCGKGRIYLSNDEVFEVNGGSLVLLEWKDLKRYHCSGSKWNFWWFEFAVNGPLNVPLYQVIPLPDAISDSDKLAQIQKAFRSKKHILRRMASGLFLVLLYEWFQRYREKIKGHHEGRIEAMINLMSQDPAKKWNITEMARQAGMSDAWFRREFHRMTGNSPKKFIESIRMAWADEHLRTSNLTISEIAYKLGFSSPFHFSRVFSSHFRCPPSSVRALAESRLPKLATKAR